MHSDLLSPEERAQVQNLRAKGSLNPLDLDSFLEKEQARQAASLKTIAGMLCYVDPSSQTLYIEDFQSEKIRQAYALKPEPSHVPKDPERWGDTSILAVYQDGKQSQSLHLSLAKQGLLITAGLSYLYPFTTADSQMGISSHYYSPYYANPDIDAYDLVCSPGHDMLFVVHRWAGKVSLFSLPGGRLLGQFNIREEGSQRSINIAVDVTQRKAYLSDNETDQLHVLDLNTKEISSHALFLGRLGNLTLDRNPLYLYLEVLSDEVSMAYLDLEHLSVITLLDIKGQSLCLHAEHPVDLMQLTPDKELLLFMTYLDEPQPFTPVVNVIETQRTRTIRRYAIKEGGPIQHLAIAHPNMHHFKPGHLLAKFLEHAEGAKQILDREPVHTKTVDHQLGGDPHISLPDLAEDSIVAICQSELESRYHINLRLHPMEKRKLRAQAVGIRKDLEQSIATEAELQILNRFTYKLPLDRQRVLRQMAGSKTKEPLYLPQENCPICGIATDQLPCSACGFSLKTTSAETKENKLQKRVSDQNLNEHQQGYIDLLKRVSFLKEASPELLHALARCLNNQTLAAGEHLLKEGEPGACLYFVMEGQLKVYKGDDSQNPIATLIEGDIVGEMSVVTSEARSASVLASEDCILLRLDRAAFIHVIIQHPDFSKQLKALAYTRQSMTRKFKNTLQRNTMDRVRARMAIAKLQELNIFQGAPPEIFETLASKVRSVAFMPKQDVCTQGEDADRLFFIIRGTVDVLVNEEKLTSLSEGDLFGEMAWLLQKPRSATIRTTSYGKFMELSFQDFAEAIQPYPRLQQALEHLASSRQEEITEFASLEGADTGRELPLPGLDIGIHKHVPRHTLYYLSPLEERVFRIEHNKINWSFGQHGDIRLFQPFRVQYSSDYEPRLLITDTGNDRLLEVEIAHGRVSRSWGDHNLPLIQPRSASLTPQGWMLVADEGQQRLIMINLQGEIAWEYDRHVISPYHVSQTPTGTILYTDTAMHQVIEINREGEILWTYGTAFISGSDPEELLSPAFAHRLEDGRTLIADTGNQRLLWIDADLQLSEIWTGPESYPLIDPVYCEWDAEDYLYVHSGTAENILCFSTDGEAVWQATLLPA